ncbi:MAG: N-succinylarginine dihydrolase [Alphaproteobacteria bacterium]
MISHEWQFDGLVGPSHNYAGLASGNLASKRNAWAVSNPRKAALQGLEKMQFVQSLGLKQGFLPPHPRPVIAALRARGFAGNDAKILEDAHAKAPELLAAVYSSAFMWVANAATVSASSDTVDGKLHLTPANLISHFHRSLEPRFSTRLLRHIFADSRYFTVHDPLPASGDFADEGAANHMRVAAQHEAKGVNIYVYGAAEKSRERPQKFIARQQREASEDIARTHGVKRAIYVQQSPRAIDLGVFHNDVIAMNTTRLMLAHEHAFIEGISDKIEVPDFNYIEVTDAELTVEEAVATYFFNSQLFELADGNYALIAPQECAEHPRACALLESLSTRNSPRITHHFLDVRESMRNGGGPACLRLRVVMNEMESAAMHPGIILTEKRYAALQQWVQQFYRDRLSFDDLRDPNFPTEIAVALEALEEIIGMQGLYQL